MGPGGVEREPPGPREKRECVTVYRRGDVYTPPASATLYTGECAECGSRIETRSVYCTPCRRARRKDQQTRYLHSPKGQAVRQKVRQSSRHKLTVQAWLTAHPDMARARRDRAREQRRQKSPIGSTLHCSTEMCNGTFVRTRFNGKRMFCDECRRLNRLWNLRMSYVRRRKREGRQIPPLLDHTEDAA